MTRADARLLNPKGTTGRHRSLFWRLLPTYLIVIVVAAATTLLSGESVGPYFLHHHVDEMMRGVQGTAMQAMVLDMSNDLGLAYRRALTSSLVWAILASAATSGLVALFVTRRIVAPLRAMRRASRRIANGSYQDRLDPGAPGEVGDLAEAFNAMAETLEHTERTRMELLADVAHEFRTPLSNLRGYVEGIEDGVFRPDKPVFGACKRQLERLDHLIEDLSLLSRLETGQVALNPAPVAPRVLLEQAVADLAPGFVQKGVRLRIVAQGSSPAVLADPERTPQVLTNLLQNALRFTPSGREVRLDAIHEGDAVRFDVLDQGPGIDPADAPHVFRRFYRGDKSRGRDDGAGSGIGLTIARNLVERQGGDIGVASTPGSGAHFWFTLPVAPG